MFSKRTTSDWQCSSLGLVIPSAAKDLNHKTLAHRATEEGRSKLNRRRKTTAEDTLPPVYEARTSRAGEF
jgi:hypothetical protein